MDDRSAGSGERGKRAGERGGMATGSGSGAGGGGMHEDIDSDSASGAGGNEMPAAGPKPDRGGDAPSHGSR